MYVRHACAHERLQDTVARQIRKLRAHFNEPYVKTDRIRSHSARHRAINDLKASGIDREVGKQFARISDDAVWAGYGRLSAVQAGRAMHQNVQLQQAWSGAIPRPGE